MMGKQGRGSFSSGKAGGSTGVKKKMVIKPFKVSLILRTGRLGRGREICRTAWQRQPTQRSSMYTRSHKRQSYRRVRCARSRLGLKSKGRGTSCLGEILGSPALLRNASETWMVSCALSQKRHLFCPQFSNCSRKSPPSEHAHMNAGTTAA